MSYQDRGGKVDEDSNDGYFTQSSDLRVEHADDTVSSVLNIAGWITIVTGIAIGFFAATNTSLASSLGGLAFLVAVMLSSPIIVSGILLIAAGSLVKSTAATARNTRTMLAIMQQ